MSAFNITGEEADPVRSFVFREFREYSNRKKAEETEAKDQLDKLRAEERKQRNKDWRQSRDRRGRPSPHSLDWSSEPTDRSSGFGSESGRICCQSDTRLILIKNLDSNS